MNEALWWPNWNVDRLHAVLPDAGLGHPYARPEAVCGIRTFNPHRLREMEWARKRLDTHPPKCQHCLRRTVGDVLRVARQA
jgi:hypothetical protein